MGREAICTIRWGEKVAPGKVLLEGSELIVRGAVKRRVPIAALEDVVVHNNELLFSVGGVPVTLGLGSISAQRWMEALQTPPHSLAKRLGISPRVLVHAWGKIDAEELIAAIAEGTGGTPNLVLIRASTPGELEIGLRITWPTIQLGVPVWIVYRKGKASRLGETLIRDTMRNMGFVDTKVTSITITLTGLRFVRRAVEEE